MICPTQKQKDKSRASYYNYYTNKKWGDPDSYQLSVDTGILGTEGAVKVILEYIRIKEELGSKKVVL